MSASIAVRANRVPVEAIYYEDDLPSEWADYYKANVEFLDEIGSPGVPLRWAPTILITP